MTEYLQQHFRDIVDLGFTSSMEEKLDKVEDGTEQWKELLQDFYGEFNRAHGLSRDADQRAEFLLR